MLAIYICMIHMFCPMHMGRRWHRLHVHGAVLSSNTLSRSNHHCCLITHRFELNSTVQNFLMVWYLQTWHKLGVTEVSAPSKCLVVRSRRPACITSGGRVWPEVSEWQRTSETCPTVESHASMQAALGLLAHCAAAAFRLQLPLVPETYLLACRPTESCLQRRHASSAWMSSDF